MSDTLLCELEKFAQAKLKLTALVEKNEAATKASLIDPYIKLLGFDTADPLQVRVEFRTATVKAADKVDYALMYGEKPVAYVEAKALSHRDLSTPTPMNKQLRSYMLDSTTVRFGALTDGRQWIWYCQESYQHEPSPFLIIDALSDSQSETFSWLSLLRSKAPVEELLIAAKTELLTSMIRNWVEGSIQSPSDALARTILREIGQPSNQKARLEQCKQVWTRVVGGLWGSEDTSPPPMPPIPTPPPPRPLGKISCVIRYSDGRVDNFKNATALMIGIVRFCSENHREGKQDYYHRVSRPHGIRRNSPAVVPETDIASGKYPKSPYSRIGIDGYRIFNDLNNTAKVPLIKALLKQCTLNSGKSPQIGRELEVHMPNSDFQIPDLTDDS